MCEEGEGLVKVSSPGALAGRAGDERQMDSGVTNKVHKAEKMSFT